MCGWFYPYGGGFFGGGSWMFMFPMLIFWAVLIYGVIVLVRKLSANAANHNDDGNASLNALKILNERYAKGEIDKTEYENIRSDLLKK